LGACIYEAGLALACGRNPPMPAAHTDAVGGQFNFITFGEDRAESLLDFDQARAVPGLTAYVSPGQWVKQVSEFGIVLAQIDLFGSSYEEIHAEANRLRRQLLKQPDSSPW
ncbi:MAG: hypothetical protein ACREQ3_27280, partial [Candidatus Binatia bacterium]